MTLHLQRSMGNQEEWEGAAGLVSFLEIDSHAMFLEALLSP